MDAIILAGGKGSRLDGVMPPYWKPLMPINGVPLIRRIVGQVAGYVDTTFVIVAPENALQVAQVLAGCPVLMVVQPNASGPGHALQIGLKLSRADASLVLMGDNLLADSDVCQVATCGHDFVVGVQRVSYEDSARFTRVLSPVKFEEGLHNTCDPSRGMPWVWCGPLVLPRDHTLQALGNRFTDLKQGIVEQKIGTHLTELAELHGPAKLEEVAAIDIGTPEAIVEVQA